MTQIRQFTAIIEREGDGYVARCPELDIASQGTGVEEARDNLVEALELFFETADASEIEHRLHPEVFLVRSTAWRRSGSGRRGAPPGR